MGASTEPLQRAGPQLLGTGRPSGPLLRASRLSPNPAGYFTSAGALSVATECTVAEVPLDYDHPRGKTTFIPDFGDALLGDSFAIGRALAGLGALRIRPEAPFPLVLEYANGREAQLSNLCSDAE